MSTYTTITCGETWRGRPATDTSWMTHGACTRDGVDPEIFFDAANKRARKICGACPVRAACDEFAAHTGTEYGRFGGRSARTIRDRTRARRRQARAEDQAATP